MSTKVYSQITNQIIQAIEASPEAWTMPWHTSHLSSPQNATTGRGYRGVNILALWAAAQNKGYKSGLWATYKQWKEVNAQVRKGEKSTTVVFWKFLKKEQEDDNGNTTTTSFPMARAYNVFNIDQVDGFELPVVENDNTRIDRAEQFVKATGADFREGGDRAFYHTKDDYIRIPNLGSFLSTDAYYATLFHELCHWTGHSSRCDRDMSNRFGVVSYAAEELVAELGAAFLCSDLGITNEPRADHASYIDYWLKLLKGDNKAIFTASSKAQQATDWLHDHVTTTAPAAPAAPRSTP